MGNIYGDFERDQLNKMKINATLKAFALVLRKRMFRDKTEEEQEFIKQMYGLAANAEAGGV